MGSFETNVADNMLIDAAERVITANIDLDWEKVESHAELERIAQDIEVEAYNAQRRVAEALHSIAASMKAQSRLKKVMASMDGDAFETKYAELGEVEERLALATKDLQSYLNSVFGSIIDPMMAIKLLAAAKKELLRHAEDIAQTIPGYEMIKPSDAGRAVTSPSKGTGHVTHVEPEQVLIAWESGEEEWVSQDALATGDVKLGDESGTAVTAEGDGDTAASAVQGPSDNPEGTIGMADRERNPLMDYLQGYELDEEQQEGPKKAPAAKPAPTKMNMSASVDYPTDKPGATKSNPQEPETINPTPKNTKYRLEALDEATKTWKEVGVYDSIEKANEKSDKLKEELPMTMETKVTPLVGLDKDGNPDYKTTPKGPEGDNTEQTVKEVKAADDRRWCSTCDDWVATMDDGKGCMQCWSPTMSAEEKKEADDELEGRPQKRKSAIDDDDAYEEAVKQYLDQTNFNPPEWLEPAESKELTALMAQDAATLNRKQTKRLNELYDNAVSWYLNKSDFNPEDFGVKATQRRAVAPEGWEGTVKKLKKHKDKVDNPFALAWWMKGEGYKPGGKKKSSLSYRQGAWELWLEQDAESPIVSQDPAVVAYVTANKLQWSLKRASAIMRYVKDLDVPFVIYTEAAKKKMKTIDKTKMKTIDSWGCLYCDGVGFVDKDGNPDHSSAGMKCPECHGKGVSKKNLGDAADEEK